MMPLCPEYVKKIIGLVVAVAYLVHSTTRCDDISDGGIKTKNKTNNSDCELNDKYFNLLQ